jgi:hypothetical protein
VYNFISILYYITPFGTIQDTNGAVRVESDPGIIPEGQYFSHALVVRKTKCR